MTETANTNPIGSSQEQKTESYEWQQPQPIPEQQVPPQYQAQYHNPTPVPPTYVQNSVVANNSANISGGIKAAWLFIGLLVGIPGILIAFVSRDGMPDRRECVKWSAIGLAIQLAMSLLFVFVIMQVLLGFAGILAADPSLSIY